MNFNGNGNRDKMNHSRSGTGMSSVSKQSTLSKSLSSYGIGSNTVKGRYDTNATRAVWIGRIIFVISLAVVAGLLGYLAHSVLTDSEVKLTEKQFCSIADRAKKTILLASKAKRKGAESMAEVIASANPRASQHPQAALANFEGVARDLIAVSKGCNMAYMSIVWADGTEEGQKNLTDFEEWAYKFYTEEHIPEPFPNTSGISSFGLGVFSKDKSLDKEQVPDQRFHNTQARVMWGNSSNQGKLVTPMLHHSTGFSKNLLMDMHSVHPLYGPLVDDMLECSERRRLLNDTSIQCAAITPLIENKTSWIAQIESGPGASMMYPVYPVSDPFTGEVLNQAFAPGVSGIDVVLRTGEQAYTFEIKDGEARLKDCECKSNGGFLMPHENRTQLPGFGDCHDPQFDSYARNTTLTPPELFSNTSVPYTMHVYANRHLFPVYHTQNPKMATIGAVTIVLTVALVFFFFDKCVRKEFHDKTDLLESKRRFVAFVSHEIRTPLNSVCMGLSLVQEEIEKATKKNKPIDASDVEEWLALTSEVHCNTRASVDVLNDLLNYDKVETGTLSLELTVIPIFDLIQNTVQEFKLPAAKKKIGLNFSIYNSDGMQEKQAILQDLKVVGDKIRLCQVLRNLVSNAIKFTPENGDLNVNLFMEDKNSKMARWDTMELQNKEEICLQRHGYLRVDIKDSGVGMTKDQLRTVFKQGTQFNVNKLQEGQGSGLGLYIAKGIVEQHKGRLSVDSEGLGKGTTFSILIPLHRSPDPKNSVQQGDHSCTAFSSSLDLSFSNSKENSTEENISEENSSGKEAVQDSAELANQRILVVEDAAMNRKLMVRILTNHGHKVVAAEDGHFSVEMVREAMAKGERYDTILLDNIMPTMSGPEAARLMREMGCDSFMVGVTGSIMQEDVDLFKESGVNAVLPKPFKISLLEGLWIEYGIQGENSTELAESQGLELEHQVSPETRGSTQFRSDEELGLTDDLGLSRDDYVSDMEVVVDC